MYNYHLIWGNGNADRDLPHLIIFSGKFKPMGPRTVFSIHGVSLDACF